MLPGLYNRSLCSCFISHPVVRPVIDELIEKFADDKGLKIVDICLSESIRENHLLRYDAGIEEFIALIDNADYVVTNSLHGTIFSIIMHKNFATFIRKNGCRKIEELLKLLSLENRLCCADLHVLDNNIDYEDVEKKLDAYREKSELFIRKYIN